MKRYTIYFDCKHKFGSCKVEANTINEAKLKAMAIKKTHGGARKGAGRKSKEPTKTIRIPISKLNEVYKIIGKIYL